MPSALGAGSAATRRSHPRFWAPLCGALAGGLLLIFMGFKARSDLPNIYFIFSLVGLGGILLVITHPARSTQPSISS